MLHLINNGVSLLGSVWAVEGISVYFTALKNIFLVVVVVMHYKLQKNQEQGHGLETVNVFYVFVILSNRNCQTNLFFQTEIAVTPFAVCLCAANRDKTTRTVFPFRFTTRASRGCYETTTYSPLVKSLIMYVYFSKTFEFKIGIHFVPHPGYTCRLVHGLKEHQLHSVRFLQGFATITGLQTFNDSPLYAIATRPRIILKLNVKELWWKEHSLAQHESPCFWTPFKRTAKWKARGENKRVTKEEFFHGTSLKHKKWQSFPLNEHISTAPALISCTFCSLASFRIYIWQVFPYWAGSLPQRGWCEHIGNRHILLMLSGGKDRIGLCSTEGTGDRDEGDMNGVCAPVVSASARPGVCADVFSSSCGFTCNFVCTHSGKSCCFSAHADRQSLG